MQEVLVQGFILGLISGPLCAGTCAPVFLSFALAREDGGLLRQGRALGEFLGGRLVGYVAVGLDHLALARKHLQAGAAGLPTLRREGDPDLDAAAEGPRRERAGATELRYANPGDLDRDDGHVQLGILFEPELQVAEDAEQAQRERQRQGDDRLERDRLDDRPRGIGTGRLPFGVHQRRGGLVLHRPRSDAEMDVLILDLDSQIPFHNLLKLACKVPYRGFVSNQPPDHSLCCICKLAYLVARLFDIEPVLYVPLGYLSCPYRELKYLP